MHPVRKSSFSAYLRRKDYEISWVQSDLQGSSSPASGPTQDSPNNPTICLRALRHINHRITEEWERRRGLNLYTLCYVLQLCHGAHRLCLPSRGISLSSLKYNCNCSHELHNSSQIPNTNRKNEERKRMGTAWWYQACCHPTSITMH